MYLYGASGHAKVIIDILKSQGVTVDGLVDDNESINELMSIPVVHQRLNLSPMIISIGDNYTRMCVKEKLVCEFGTAVAPTAVVSDSAKIGEGTVVMQNATIQSCAKIGKHCIVNTSASIDHECVIGNFVHIAPNVALCGNVTVGEGTLIGVGSCVIPGVKIGKWCVIGAGSVVVSDIPDFSLAYGNVCKVIKRNDMKYIGLKIINGGG